MRIYDAFMVFDEQAVLSIRFAELQHDVDVFCVVESSVSFQGNTKPLYFMDAARANGWPLDKIHYHVAEAMPALYENASHPLEREAYQRDQLYDALLAAGAEDDDLVLISDADEIPRAAVVRMLADGALPLPAMLGQKLHYYALNNVNRSVSQWYGTRACKMRLLHTEPPEVLRHDQGCTALKDAGWSWSFFGTAEDAQRKLAAWSHHEWNRPPFNSHAHLAAAISSGRDWDTDRAMTFQPVKLERFEYPACLFDEDGNMLRQWWPYLLKPEGVTLQ
jgi:hypothetical protein